MAARKRKYQTDSTRKKIQASQLINRLQDFIDGKVEMNPAQVRAAEILLKKTLPDLSSMEMVAEVEHSSVGDLTDEQLAAIAAGRRSGAAQAQGGEEKPAGVH